MSGMKEETACLILENVCIMDLTVFTGNNIGDTGAASLGEALESNTTLAKLHLESDYMTNIQRAYINNSLFPFLFISTGNWIGDTAAASLSESLKSNTTLIELCLSCEDKRKKTHKRHPSTIHSFPCTEA